MAQRAVIVGSGAAAYECVSAMVESGYPGEIHVFSNTKRPPYNPMLTTYYAVGKLPFSGLFPYGDTLDVWEKLGVIFHSEDPVVALKGAERTLITASGTSFSFDHCLIATGATPVLPPFPGHESKKLFLVRTVEDAIALHAVAQKKPRRVMVVGASMVGVKVVELFHKAGAETVLLDLAPHIFSLAAHPDCADAIHKRLESQGVVLRFGAGMTAVEDTDDGVRLLFGEGQPPEEGDLAVICVGVRANLSSLADKSIETDRGILVNNYMETNIPGIYAAGDVAQGLELLSGQRHIIGLWANARMQGRIAGYNMAGIIQPYRGNILHNITHFMGMDFVGLGQVKNYTRMETTQTDHGLSMLFWDNDKLIGANFLDNYLNCGVLRNALTNSLVTSETPPRYVNEHARILAEIVRNISLP